MDMEDYQKAREQIQFFKDKFPGSDLQSAAEKNLQKVIEQLEQQNKK
jgi:outer membrane protein assembly factor BamD (BamD/ComL family)